MHTHAVQRRRCDFVQTASPTSACCQMVRSRRRRRHLGRHDPSHRNTGFGGGLADGAPSSTAPTIHAEHSLLLLLLLLMLLLLLPQNVVHTFRIHAVLHCLCSLSLQSWPCVHHVRLGTQSYHVASTRRARGDAYDGGALLGGAGIRWYGGCPLTHLLQSLGLAMLVDLIDDALDRGKVGLCGQG